MSTIFITGASSGLGKAAVKLFHSNGWKVIATMRDIQKETELKTLPNVTVLSLDVTNPSQIEAVVKNAMEYHNVDVVLNNAGYGLVGPFEAFSDEQITRQINTNLLGVIRVTKAFIPYFRERKSGLFINISSIFGLMGYPTCSVYSAPKWAIEGFTESVGYDLAYFGINVKLIAPGGIQTDFAGRSLDGAQHEAYSKLVTKVSEGYSAEKISMYATAEQVAEIIYAAATDGKNQLRYVAGTDAIALYNERLTIGTEAQYRKVQEMFLD